MEFSEIAAMLMKTGALFFLTLVCFRLMGYRSLGDMEPLDYVIVLGIGEIMGSPVGSPERGVLFPAAAIVALTFLQMLLSALYSKMPKLNRMMEGKPVPVIRDGKIIEKNLARNRVDKESIREELRIKGVRDEKDVDMAFLEPSGRFSVILKNEASPLTPRYIGEKGSFILVENAKIRPADWKASGVSDEEVLAFLKTEAVEAWEEVETLLYKNGSFFLEKKPEEDNEE